MIERVVRVIVTVSSNAAAQFVDEKPSDHQGDKATFTLFQGKYTLTTSWQYLTFLNILR